MRAIRWRKPMLNELETSVPALAPFAGANRCPYPPAQAVADDLRNLHGNGAITPLRASRRQYWLRFPGIGAPYPLHTNHLRE